MLLTSKIFFVTMFVDWLLSCVIVRAVTIKAVHANIGKHKDFTSGKIYCMKEIRDSPLMTDRLRNEIENLGFSRRSTNGNPVKTIGNPC